MEFYYLVSLGGGESIEALKGEGAQQKRQGGHQGVSEHVHAEIFPGKYLRRGGMMG